ncbi:winged helix-turn-helix domain-containing protein [Kribbella jiaozuonensis]|uniref:Winged helix-turn-helix transcriptional regulator n=1 Tax=Kribbella jiaozuonensis TaxID=2575441 RepID=A0A4U3M4K8_9ACTN|nr:winged helix-turn-helix domain-containing protein [Kribbella jiaozuonensis]TKK82296.1 winged helix-turn-helix transcriptional regulator [Kribbella jiaozuonensis]
MTLLKLSPLALSRSRFALSPLAETVGAIISLRRARPDPWMSAWYANHQKSFDRRLRRDPFLRGLADLLSSTKWLPDVVALPPTGGMGTSLSAELEQVAAMNDAEIRAAFKVSLQHSWLEHDLRWLESSDLGRSLASAVRTVWSRHVAPDWPRRREALEREVIYRAGLLAAFGWPKALEGMSRRSRWIGADSIQFSNRPGVDRHVGDEGLQFVPVTLQGGTWLCESETAGYALVYPARRVAVEFPADGRVALERLIGRGRAELLLRLSRPGTASELAEELGLSLGTVGRHLRILRDAGLIVGVREGHKVVYRVTVRGTELGGGQVAGDLGVGCGGEDWEGL